MMSFTQTWRSTFAWLKFYGFTVLKKSKKNFFNACKLTLNLVGHQIENELSHEPAPSYYDIHRYVIVALWWKLQRCRVYRDLSNDIDVPPASCTFIYLFIFCVTMWIDRSVRCYGRRRVFFNSESSWVLEYRERIKWLKYTNIEPAEYTCRSPTTLLKYNVKSVSKAPLLFGQETTLQDNFTVEL